MPSTSVYCESEVVNLHRKQYLTNQWTMLSSGSLIDWLSEYTASFLRWFLFHKLVGLLNLIKQRFQCHSKTMHVHINMFERSKEQYFINEQNKFRNCGPAFFILSRMVGVRDLGLSSIILIILVVNCVQTCISFIYYTFGISLEWREVRHKVCRHRWHIWSDG